MTDKQQSENQEEAVKMKIEEFLAIRKEAGLKIDPQTADLRWGWAQVADPYGIYPDLTDEEDCIGRVYFARSPVSDVWVEFRDLPDATRDALWQKLDDGGFPDDSSFVCRPDSLLAELLDTTARIEGLGAEIKPEELAALVERLAVKFELMGGQRERDLARLFRAIADASHPRWEFELEYEEDQESGESEEDKPLAGDKRA